MLIARRSSADAAPASQLKMRAGLDVRPGASRLKDKPVSHMDVREAIMAMSEDERRQLRVTEAELSQQRRLANLASRLKSAGVDTG